MEVALYGQNERQNVVAVQQLNEQQVRIYVRSDGKVSHEDVEFFPFFFLADPEFLDGFPHRIWLKELAGHNFFRFIAAFSRWNDMWEAVRFVLNNYNKTAPKRATSYTETDALLLRPDPVTQYLLQSGMTLFKGMTFADLHRLQIGIQTLSKSRRPSDPRKTEDRIVVIALADSRGWNHYLDARKLGEREMLEGVVRIIRERDPDVIEGHNVYSHDLPYLLKRCEIHEVEPAIGRDGSIVKSYSPRGGTVDRSFEHSVFEVAGRHVVDTSLLAQQYDFSKRSLEAFSLQHLVQHFGFGSKGRTFVPRERTTSLWSEHPEVVVRHATEEVQDIRKLSDHLSPSYFFLAQMCPLSYGTVSRTGSAIKIELLMVREYIRQKHSVPKPQTGTQTTGGFTDLFATGILSNVIHADFESLYPLIMLTRQIKPSSDELGMFQILLGELTRERIEAKHRMQRTQEENARTKEDAFQSSLKILINSFYGYLGYGKGIFNDFQRADQVTLEGRELLKSIIRQVELHNGLVIEVDTDGLFFSPPDNVRGEELEEVFVSKISSSTPEGIHLALVGRYKKMLSYKKKNYALLGFDNSLSIKGSALISRSMERFVRRYIRSCIELLLHENIAELHDLFVSYHRSITAHEWEALDFARTETIRDTMEAYDLEIKEGSRKPSAAYEVVKKAEVPVRPGDRLTYYVTGSHPGVKIIENCRLAEEWDRNFPDENTAHYLERLEESSKKFEPFFEREDFKKVFSSDDLFGFSAEGIKIINKFKGTLGEPPSSEEESSEIGIWLDDQPEEGT